MPELPEVEAFSWTLLKLKSSNGELLQLERTRDNPPRTFISDEHIAFLNNNCTVLDVKRKGKQLCMVLDCIKPIEIDGEKRKQAFLFVHMGMTGRISAPGEVPSLKELKEGDEYPPPYTYMSWKVVDSKKKVIAEASFSDPRKFGSVELKVDDSSLDELAPDGLSLEEDGKVEEVVEALTEQTKPIKAILLDQKKVVCGVGNWVADEIMYQCEIHPEQKFLTKAEAELVVAKMTSILKIAVDHLKRKEDFPEDWMFNYRWTKKRKDSKDSQGRTIDFVKSGGRTSAIVASIQKLQGREKSVKSKPAGKAKAPAQKKKPSKQTAAKKKDEAKVETKKDYNDEKEPEVEEPTKPAKAKKAAKNKGSEDEPAPKKRAGRSKRNAETTAKDHVGTHAEGDDVENKTKKETARASKRKADPKETNGKRSKMGSSNEELDTVPNGEEENVAVEPPAGSKKTSKRGKTTEKEAPKENESGEARPPRRSTRNRTRSS